jgi:hypothetical protein
MFGITPSEYDLIWDHQGKVCAICQRNEPGLKFGVDHDHASGEVRGILCTLCNYYFLGRYESLQRLRAAVAYLENPPATTVLNDNLFKMAEHS